MAKSIDEIKVAVDKAIENKDPREIDTIKEQRDLRIAQRYLDQLIFNEGLEESRRGALTSLNGAFLAFFAIFFAIFLTGLSALSLTDKAFGPVQFWIGVGGIILLAILWKYWEPKVDEKYDTKKKEIEFMQKLVLIIEGRLEN
jgi:hypothetical protein